MLATSGHKYQKKDGTVSTSTCSSYKCYNRTFSPGKCDGQTSFSVEKLDNLHPLGGRAHKKCGMKRYDLYSKRDPAKIFSPLPNKVFYLSMSYGAIAVYSYLIHIEDRNTFQSYASYNTIGRAVKMSATTVRK